MYFWLPDFFILKRKESVVVKNAETVLTTQTVQFQILTPFRRCETSDKLLNFFLPLFPNL